MQVGIQKNPHETTLVPVPREARIDISLKLQSTFSSFARRLLINQNDISFHKASKARRPSFILSYWNFHTGRIGKPGLTKVHLCILLRILPCPLPDILVNLSIYTCVRKHL
ncbi:hypothetical protein AVEN_53022-1 [Araneus ventricosus]|uniref:Uncharacterized protein n=1 Tax=Araneus ventricosus TaxID=182803 RepID=A0A4Y2GCX1_ARAVE|nr:hypothetical protein AVEN_53022-1 [Araneus ventricosus]